MDSFIPPPVDYAALPGRTPRCLGCGYTLTGLPEPRCPECGRFFDPASPSTFTYKPPLVRWRYWVPGFMLALGGGLALYAFAAVFAGFSWATTLVVPACAGALLGYGTRVRPFVLVVLGLALAVGLLVGVASLNLVGVFCGLIMAGIAVGPLLLGTLCGFLLRRALKNSRFDQRWHLPMIAALLVGLLAACVDRATWTTPPVEAVRTVAELPMPVDAAWANVRFYEQVPGRRPVISRWRWLGLAQPLAVTGVARREGDRTACVYDKGRLVKQVTEVAAGDDGSRRLAFRVVEQGFELHAMRLVGGSFDLSPAGEGRTRVTLETAYVPHMAPRWCWRPFERWTVRTLHGHVLASMASEDGASNGTLADRTDAPPAVSRWPEGPGLVARDARRGVNAAGAP